MPKAPKREYTPEQKAEALAYFPSKGPAETARLTRIPSSTIKTWARAAGLKLDGPPRDLKVAVETAALNRRQKREAILDELHDQVMEILELMRAEHIEYRVLKDGQQVSLSYSKPPSKSLKEYSEVVVNFINTIRLESGEVTARTENVTTDEASAFLLGLATSFEESKAKK